MIKKAIISVSSENITTKESAIEVVTPGEFYKKDDCYYAIYDETELSGMEGTRTTLKIEEDAFSLSRVGTTTTDMNFKESQEDVVLYNTPYGALELRTKTKELKIDVNEDGGQVFLNYNMSISGQPAQTTVLKINIKV